MAKSFFKVYVEIKKEIMHRRECYLIKETDLTSTCFDAMEHYLNQYTWVHHEEEKICFDFCEDDISLEEVAQINEISYNTLRSLTSRVSARLYKRFGYDFKEVILGTDVKKQHRIISCCDSSVDEYKLEEHYPAGLLSIIEMETEDIEISDIDRFKIARKDLVILKFLADLDFETISERLGLMDAERLALICYILSKKKYYNERCEVLRIINKLKDKESPEYWQNDVDILAGVKTVVSNKE